MPSFENPGFREPPPPYSALDENGKAPETMPSIPPPPRDNYQPPVMTYSEPQFGTQQYAYNQPHTYTQQIIVSQPGQPGMIVVQPRPPDYICPAVLVCICCFWPTGICAIYYASRANDFARMGDMEESQRLSTLARHLIVCSIILGIICTTLYVILRYAI